MRAAINICCLIIYSASMNFYFYTLTHIPIRYSKLWFAYSMLFGILQFLIDDKFGMKSYLQKEFNWMMKFAVVVNYLILIMVNHCLIDERDIISRFVIFNGSIFVVSILILISAARHNVFNSFKYPDAD